MQFTTKFKVLVAALVLLLVTGGLAYHQYLLQKQLNSVMQFDTKVMKQDLKTWDAIKKLATVSATPTATPTPKLFIKHNLTK